MSGLIWDQTTASLGSKPTPRACQWWGHPEQRLQGCVYVQLLQCAILESSVCSAQPAAPTTVVHWGRSRGALVAVAAAVAAAAALAAAAGVVDGSGGSSGSGSSSSSSSSLVEGS
jgi:hypothetical protein